MFCARVCKPNSVVHDNLSGPYVAVKLKRHFPIARDTALHSDKDFAVSPPPKGGTRLCSHLLRPQKAYGRRYLLPVSGKTRVSVRTFLPNCYVGAVMQRAGSYCTTSFEPSAMPCVAANPVGTSSTYLAGVPG